MSLILEFRAWRQAIRDLPAPGKTDPPGDYLRFIAGQLLAAMLSWRFVVLLAAILFIAWLSGYDVR